MQPEVKTTSSSSSSSSSSILLRTATEADARACAELVVDAYAPLHSSQLLFPGPPEGDPERRAIQVEARHEQFAAQLRGDGGAGRHQPSGPNARRWPVNYVVACDRESGALLSLMRWGVIELPPQNDDDDDDDNDKAAATIATVDAMIDNKWQALNRDAARFNAVLFRRFLLATSDAHEALWRGRGPHGVLMTLATLPTAQRRGVGAALMKHYCNAVDELSLPGYLEASTEGERLYARFGFTEQQRLRMQEERDGTAHFELAIMQRDAVRRRRQDELDNGGSL